MTRGRRHPDQQQFDVFAGDYDKRFIETYRSVYVLFQEQLFRTLKQLNPPLSILDIGCGNGWVAEQIASESIGDYVGVDPSAASLKILKDRMVTQESLKVATICHSAEWLCKKDASKIIVKQLGQSPQLVICNAAFHQIRKTFSDIKSLLLVLYELQAFDGISLFGDYYYPKNIPESDIQKTLEWIKEKTGQNPTKPEEWFQPDEIQTILKEVGYKIEGLFETQANTKICLKYYLIKCTKVRSSSLV